MTDALRLLFAVALRITAIALGLYFVANGVFMLASPSAWFNLPEWFAPRGAHMTPEKYASGWALEMRLLGVVFLGTPIWVVYDMFRPR